ncbi:MAG: type I-F CRISPR-associated endoribonuclease Cas6/Csy4 [Thalassotalea sp.]
MKHYLDITLLPETEITLGFIWQKVYQQVHIALVDHGYESERKLKHGDTKILRNSKIAVSFPEYKNHAFPLGSKLRLFAQTKEELEMLDIQSWLNRLIDYVDIGSIQLVPDGVGEVVFLQKRVKGIKRLDESLQKKANHISTKFGVDFNVCLKELKAKHSFEKCLAPFIQLESQTSKQRGDRGLFQIYIEKLECTEPANGEYDCYGLALSKTATVPWF